MWDKFPVSHTHIHTDTASLSTLEHVLADPVLLQAIEEASAIHLGNVPHNVFYWSRVFQ